MCSNPGSATPEGLHQLYKSRAATTANPYLLRQANVQSKLTTDSVVTSRVYVPPQLRQSPPQTPSHQPQQQAQAQAQQQRPAFQAHPLYPIHAATRICGCCASAASAPSHTSRPQQLHFPPTTTSRNAPLCGVAGTKSALRVLNAGAAAQRPAQPPLGITLHSLDFRAKR